MWIEGDLNNVIQCLKEKSSPSWMSENIINASKNIINTFKEFNISHNYREGNCVANYFAITEVRINTRKVWYNKDTMDFEVQSLLMHDQTHGRYKEIPTIFDDEIH